jgi:succinoglycan biosynthesis protein ExoM
MSTITIAIASSGRDSLRACLTSLAGLKIDPAHTIDIVIADDSSDGRVAALLEALTPLPFPIATVITAARNVAVARNACLDAARGDLLAFIDDDEWADPEWLQRLLAAMDEFSADCVFGPVHPVYPPGTPDWIVRANPLHVDWGRRGKRVTVGRGGNTLMKRCLVETHGLRFDPALGRTGGEDTTFFHAFGAAGGVMVVTDDALVHEDAPPSRVNITYFRHRALRTGQIYARFVTAQIARSRLQRLRFYGGALIKAVVALGGGALLYPIDRADWLKLAMRGWMNAGKLRELFKLAPSHMS